MSTTIGAIISWPVSGRGADEDDRRVKQLDDFAWLDEKSLGGFEVTVPNIYPAVFTQPYNAESGGVIFAPLSPVDAQVFQTLNTTTSDKDVAFDGNGQTIVHPKTGVMGERITLGARLLAIRWYFSDPNNDGSGTWYAIPNMSQLTA